MLKIKPKAITFKSEVSIHVPGQDEPEKIVVEFRHLGRKEYLALFDKTAPDDDNAAWEKLHVERLLAIIVGWENVDLPFNEENLIALLDTYYNALPSLLTAYNEGLFSAKAKN